MLLEVSSIAELSHIIYGCRHTLYLIHVMDVFTVHAFEQLLKDRFEIVVQVAGLPIFIGAHNEVP